MTSSDAADPDDTLAPGTQLGRYQIVRLMGRGGMGAVYEGTHRDLKKRVAIKTLHPAVAASPGARARFLREGEAASRIQHPNVVDVTDVGIEGNTAYLVMEFLEGEDLAALIGRRGALSFADAVDIMLPVIGAIAAAHEEGVIHRDLKPGNIFMASSRHSGSKPMVLDFGISKISTAGGASVALTGTGASMGTPHYIPPEQIRSAAGADGRSDQYALGTILYECVTGKRAHQGETIYEIIRSVGDGSFLPPRIHRPDIPAALEQAILRAMQLDPARRFPSVKAFGRAIMPFASPAGRAEWAPALAGGAEGDLPGPPTPAPTPATEPTTARGAQAGPNRILPAPGPVPAPGGPPPMTTLSASAVQVTKSAPRRPALIAAGAVVLAVGAAGAYFVLSPGAPKPGTPTGPAAARVAEAPPAAAPAPAPKPPERYRVAVTATPGAARFDLDGRSVGTGRIVEQLALDGAEHVLTIAAPGFQSAHLRFRDRPPVEEVTLEPIVVTPPKPALAPVGVASPAKSGPRPHEGGHHKPKGATTPEARPGPPGSGAPIIE